MASEWVKLTLQDGGKTIHVNLGSNPGSPAIHLPGTLGFAVAVPIDSDTNSAAVSFIRPLGFNRQLNRTDLVHSIGDSAYSASLGWEEGEHHWNVALTGFAPTGHCAPNSLAIISLNRPGSTSG